MNWRPLGNKIRGEFTMNLVLCHLELKMKRRRRKVMKKRTPMCYARVPISHDRCDHYILKTCTNKSKILKNKTETKAALPKT